MSLSVAGKARKHLICCATFTLLSIFGRAAEAQSQYEAPDSYYSTARTAIQNGTSLRDALHNQIDGHAAVSYDNARYALQVLDEDPTRPENLTLFYDNTPLNLAAINGGSIPGWDAGASWQREHTWPRSRQVNGGGSNDTGPDNSDLHLLRPAGASNQSRSNLNYGGTGGTAPGSSGGYWYPGSAHRGESARAAFYADVRYDGSDANTVDLRLVNNSPASGTGQMGDLAALLRWHYEDPVAVTEVRRNDLIYRSTNWSSSTRYNDIGSRSFTQGNRNPFVDRPEYVHAIFIDNANDTRLTLASPTTSDANGGTTKTVNLGRVLRGAAVPAAQTVTLSKVGSDGTYYSVTTGGLATSTVSGHYNAFAMTPTGSQSINVGLNTTTAAAGLKSGTVTIDNLDVTTAGGVGRGSNDADDVVNVSLSVLDVSNSSFGTTDTNTLTLDFGTHQQNEDVTDKSFSIYNIASSLGAGLTAGLDFDSILPSGDTAAFSTAFSTFTNLAAGASQSYATSFDTSVAGDFTASYRLNFSDENLPGTISTTFLTLNVVGNVIAVPEPSTIGTVIVIVGIALIRRKRCSIDEV